MCGVVIRSDVIVASSEGVLRCGQHGDMSTVVDSAKYACYGQRMIVSNLNANSSSRSLRSRSPATLETLDAAEEPVARLAFSSGGFETI